MEDVDFSDEFCRFVQVHVPSVDEAELLLAEYRSPEGARSPEWARFQQAFGFDDSKLEPYFRTLVAKNERSILDR